MSHSTTRPVLSSEVVKPIADLLNINSDGIRSMSVHLRRDEFAAVEVEYTVKWPLPQDAPECPINTSSEGMATESHIESTTQQQASSDASGGKRTFGQTGENV